VSEVSVIFTKMLDKLDSIDKRMSNLESHNSGLTPVIKEHSRRIENLESSDKEHEASMNAAHTKLRVYEGQIALAKFVIAALGLGTIASLIKAFTGG